MGVKTILEQNSIIILLVIFIGILLFINGCNTLRFEPNVKVETGAPSSALRLELYISDAPVLGKTANVTVIINPNFENKYNKTYDIVANITLPRGFELVSGDTTWKGALEPQIEFSIVVRAIKTGNWTIEGFARNPPTGSYWEGAKGFIYITVMEDESIIWNEPFSQPIIPCEEEYVNGELVRCTFSKPS